jgi:hypothetical protein
VALDGSPAELEQLSGTAPPTLARLLDSMITPTPPDRLKFLCVPSLACPRAALLTGGACLVMHGLVLLRCGHCWTVPPPRPVLRLLSQVHAARRTRQRPEPEPRVSRGQPKDRPRDQLLLD